MRRLSTRRNAAAQFDLHFGPNMTPMVDVTLVILIFFMASAAFLGPEWFVRAALPVRGTSVANTDAPTPIRVQLTPAEGGFVMRVGDRDRLTLIDLESLLREQSRTKGPQSLVVVVEPAPGVSYESVVRVHELCARLGIRAGLAP